LFFYGAALYGLEFVEGGFEFSGELLLGVFLGGLRTALARSVGMHVVTYVDVLPRLQSLDALPGILEAISRLL
jgi:hypothetical protein